MCNCMDGGTKLQSCLENQASKNFRRHTSATREPIQPKLLVACVFLVGILLLPWLVGIVVLFMLVKPQHRKVYSCQFPFPFIVCCSLGCISHSAFIGPFGASRLARKNAFVFSFSKSVPVVSHFMRLLRILLLLLCDQNFFLQPSTSTHSASLPQRASSNPRAHK